MVVSQHGDGEFAKNLQRAMMRERGQWDFHQGKTWPQVRADLELLKKSQDIQRYIEQLMTSELVVEKTRLRVAQELSEMILSRFPQYKNLELVLMGSAVHGGAQARRVMGNTTRTGRS